MDTEQISGRITSFRQCTSRVEKKQKLMLVLLNSLLWPVLACVFVLLLIASMGLILIPLVFGWLVALLLAEYSVRKIQATGVTVTAEQLPEVWQASESIRQQFGYKHEPRIIILNHAQANAFAVKIARKKVIILYTELLDALADDPAELRFVLGHEYCHLALDFGWTRHFVKFKPVRFRYGRELTCDNAGVVAAGDFAAGVSALCKIIAGPRLAPQLDHAALVQQADELESGFAGWCVRNWLVHPPLGKRMDSVSEFAAEHSIASQALSEVSRHNHPQLTDRSHAAELSQTNSQTYTPQIPR